LIKPEWIRGAETIIEEGNLRERIKRAQEGDKRVVKAVEELKRAGIKTLKDEEWEIKDRIVIKEERIYVSEGELRGCHGRVEQEQSSLQWSGITPE